MNEVVFWIINKASSVVVSRSKFEVGGILLISFNIQELLSIIFRHYAHRPKMLARLARTCKAFQDPALNILWHTQKTLLPLLKCLPPNAWAIKEGKFSIIRNLTASDFRRIYFYCHRIRIFNQFTLRSLSQYFDAQVLPIIWSRKPSPGPLLSNVSEVNLVDGNFHGLAIYPRLVISPNVTEIRLRVWSNDFPSPWANTTAVLRKASLLNLSSFALVVGRSSSPKDAELLELLSTLHGVRRLSFSDSVLPTSRAISIISTFPMLEDLRLSVTEKEVENCVPDVKNKFTAIIHLAINSDTMNACRLMLLQLQPETLRSLTLTRTTSDANWSIRRLLITLHECNLASRLKNLHVRDGSWTNPGLDLKNLLMFEYTSSFKQLCRLHLESSSFDSDDNDLMKLAKCLPQLRSLLFSETVFLEEVPKCTFTGMQHLIQFCPKLEMLTLRVDARQIPIFATQPDGEYPSALHLTTLNLGNSPISNADDVVSYLTMLFPVLANFSTAYYDEEEGEEEEDVDPYRAIWLKVEKMMNRFVP
ncbi:uncharacterized protein LACBIDRAFT_324746 [Laccaria bicolor S238N-H82]|uniref:Predicted protein n=1 Tax=Laccaria bicolor (strain S238N-H82 / ATCC MYA-4686) TaxID=486041 RepID=B0D2X3_LACBS|nr:uncharacterized protein LACBIDRAFT_324746 [Laccaria bicolor S238N-H82]EDR11170.1 predicted protein [Laccaria bicolor S238N-H82]|eukprot:XP_001878471.1 predicted protein [Laccaria bicolor S238N-H82]